MSLRSERLEESGRLRDHQGKERSKAEDAARAGAGERLVLEGEAGVAQLSDGDAETREVGAGTQGVPATGGELVTRHRKSFKDFTGGREKI